MTKLKAPRKSYADRRLASRKIKQVSRFVNGREYLTGCALRRGGVMHGDLRVFHSHSEIRRALGDADPYKENPNDESGFMTNKGRFVGRIEASTIAVLAGQAAPMYDGRKILSGDITWRKT